MSTVEQRTIGRYLESLAGTEPMPGGGSVAGVVAGLAAGLASMVISLTKEPGEELVAAQTSLDELRQRALECAYDDEQAYGGYLEATQLPKSSIEEKGARKEAMAQAMEHSARVPVALAIVCVEIMNALEPVIAQGNKNILGDAESSIILAQAAVDICLVNVGENLNYVKNDTLRDDLKTSIEAAGEMMVHLTSERRTQINDRRRNT